MLNDIEAGNRAGCKSILINNGNETAWMPGAHRLPEYFAKDLGEASRYIVAADKIKRDEKKAERKEQYSVHQA
ncbi:MAG: HAD hydrolase-like protein [Chitinophagaceae bacterium]|nr:HAD hydrolase-like protein [Chitinophagaceae bacterium]